MKPVPVLNSTTLRKRLAATRKPFHRKYFAMYSSVLGGIVTDPAYMLVPADDHLVHRGDGVFETFKCVEGCLYNMDAHLDRLWHSGAGLYLRPPVSRKALADVIVQTVRAAGRRDALVRVLLSRGPGSFGISPYDCPTPALYVIVYQRKRPFMELHPGGATCRTSALPVKPPPWANIKSVNYLYNVLMKKEAEDAGVDFVVSFDENGHLAEGPTENCGIVTRDRRVLVPRRERILAGTTMLRVLELARPLVKSGRLRQAGPADITKADVKRAAEVLIFGTTPDVTAVVRFDGRRVGDGRPGPVYRELAARLQDDIHRNPRLRTPAWPPGRGI